MNRNKRETSQTIHLDRIPDSGKEELSSSKKPSVFSRMKKKNKSKQINNNNGKTKLSIKTKVLLLLLCCVGISIALNLFILLSDVSLSLKQSAQSNMVDLSCAYSNSINNSVKVINNSINTLNHSAAISEYLASQKQLSFTISQEALIDYKMENNNILEVSVVNSKGMIAISTDKTKIETDVSSEPYISSILSGSDSSQSNVMDAGTENQYIVFAVPFISNMDKKMGAISVSMKTEAISETLSSLDISGYQNLEVSLVDSNGIYISNTSADQIGSKTKNPIISDVIKQIQTGKTPKAAVKSFHENGISKFSSYSVSPLNNWSLVFTVKTSEIYQPVNAMYMKTLLLSCIILAILAGVGYLFAANLARPIKQTTELINKISDLDFKEDKTYEKLITRNDENGEMSRAIIKMRASIHGILKDMDQVSVQMANTANTLNHSSIQVHNNADDNKITAEELAAAMEETTATTEVIYNNIEQVNLSAEQINQEASDGTKLTKELMQRSGQIRSNTLESSSKTKDIYHTVKEKTELAIKQSKSAEKINILTDTIMSISDQTALLALNASIEAARAGDAGKGFAVVAKEISHLAEQSSVTVKSITAIVDEVKQAVNHMTDCLNTTLALLETSILSDYDRFITISEQYSTDAQVIDSSMKQILQTAENLNTTMTHIVQSVSNINDTIGHSSVGVNNIAERNTRITSLTMETQTMAEESLQLTTKLKEIISLFRL